MLDRNFISIRNLSIQNTLLANVKEIKENVGDYITSRFLTSEYGRGKFKILSIKPSKYRGFDIKIKIE